MSEKEYLHVIKRLEDKLREYMTDLRNRVQDIRRSR